MRPCEAQDMNCKREATEQCGECSRWFCEEHVHTKRLHEPWQEQEA